jgi:hypothetical protein
MQGAVKLCVLLMGGSIPDENYTGRQCYSGPQGNFSLGYAWSLAGIMSNFYCQKLIFC